MKKFTILCLLGLGSLIGFSQTGIPVPEMTNCDNLVTQFLTTHDIPSATFAMAKNGKMVYMRAFGNADIAGTEPTQPHHMFRIASISKPITSIAIMKMIDLGQLNLADKVFGSNGILGGNSYLSAANVTDNRLYDITVQHLLEHSGGWDREIDCTPNPASPYPWHPNSCDPIGFPLHVTETLGAPNPATEENLIRFLMEKGLSFDPGTSYKYSNIGYLTLGLVIEAASGVSYEEFVKTQVLAPIGIHDMYIGKNLLEDKREREGEYVGNGFNVPSAYGTGNNVPWEYGGWNLEAMDAHGGWIATSRDLVRLLVAIDGFSTKPDIISNSSILSMTTPGPNNNGYAKGWSVNSAGNWWHTGALDGTASIWARTSGGYTWAIILNKRVIDGTSGAFWGDLDGLPWNCIGQTTSFPSHDLLDVPAKNGKDMYFSGDMNSSLTVTWAPGDGNKRVLFAKEASAVSVYPLDGIDYNADATFGLGDDLGDGNFVVYNGDGNSVDLTGLNPSSTYYFTLYEYNQSTNTGNHALFQLHEPLSESATTSTTTGLDDLIHRGISFYPNPAKDLLNIDLKNPAEADVLELRNMQGQIITRVDLQGINDRISLKELPAQLYILSFKKGEAVIGSAKLLKQ